MGVVKAVFGTPEIYLPIQNALGKQRQKHFFSSFNIEEMGTLEFFSKDKRKFRCLDLAFHAMSQGGDAPCYLTAANEVLVEGFCQGRVSWRGIEESLDELMNKKSMCNEFSLEAILEADRKGREDAQKRLEKVRL